MSLVNVENVRVLNNPTKFTDPFAFEITFTCCSPGIKEELEWKLVYVGCAEDEKYDQELDSVLVGPVAIGKNKFVLQAPAPDPAKIPERDLTEVTALLLIGLYKDAEFIRVGYFVNNFVLAEGVAPESALAASLESLSGANGAAQQATAPAGQSQQQEQDDEAIEEEDAPKVVEGPRQPVDMSRLFRHIHPQPRVTRFQIAWDSSQSLLEEAAMDLAAGAEGQGPDATTNGVDHQEDDMDEFVDYEDEDDEASDDRAFMNGGEMGLEDENAMQA